MDRVETWRQTLEIAYGGGPAKGFLWYDADEDAKVDAGLAERPRDHSLLTAKGILNFNNDAAIAIESFSRALALQPLDSHQLYNRGRQYLNTLRYSEALADLEEAVELDAEDNWKWHFLGVGHYCVGNLERAITHFEKALEVTMRHHQDLISCEADWLWTAHMHLGQVEEAKAAIDVITPDTLVVPVIADDFAYRNTCLLLNGTTPVDDYVALIEPDGVYGTASGAYYNVAKYYYFAEQNLEEAVRYLRKALADPSPLVWGSRLAAIDAPKWEAEYAAATGGADA